MHNNPKERQNNHKEQQDMKSDQKKTHTPPHECQMDQVAVQYQKS